MGVSPSDIAHVWRAFFPRGILQEVKPTTSGLIHASYQLVDAQGKAYLLQQVNQRVFPNLKAMADNFEQLHLHLPDFSEGLRFPRLFPDRSGQLLHRAPEGTVWRMQEFLPGTYTPEVCQNVSMARIAGKASGIFLRKLNEYLPHPLRETIPGFHDVFARRQKLEQAAGQASEERRQPVEAVLDNINTAWEQLHRQLPTHLPVRNVHNDPKLGNMLFDVATRQLVAVIDWDTIMPGTLITDYGDLVRTACANLPEEATRLHDVRIQSDFLEALTTGFIEGTGDFLSDAEREHLHLGPRWIILEQAMRFLTDYLQGDPYYRVQYPTQNMVRAKNQLALYASYDSLR